MFLGSLAEAGSTSSLSTGGVLSPEAPDLSHDEGFDSEDDTDHSEEYSTDNGKCVIKIFLHLFFLTNFDTDTSL